jgi:hypothetical protein
MSLKAMLQPMSRRNKEVGMGLADTQLRVVYFFE